MNLKFIQTYSKMSASYQALQNEELLYSAEIPLNFLGLKSILYKNNRTLYSLSFDMIGSLSNVIKTRKSERNLPYNILDENGEAVGDICLKRTKFFMGYSFFELRLKHTIYYIYQVGCGKKGIKITIYIGDNQIALIEKGTVTYDNKDIYEITSIDEYSAEIAVLFNIYYDFTRYGNSGEYVSKSKEISYVYTLNKELKSKYNPEFKSSYSSEPTIR